MLVTQYQTTTYGALINMGFYKYDDPDHDPRKYTDYEGYENDVMGVVFRVTDRPPYPVPFGSTHDDAVTWVSDELAAFGVIEDSVRWCASQILYKVITQ